MILTSTEHAEQDAPENPVIPQTVALLISALEAGEYSVNEKRRLPRTVYRTATSVRLFRDDATSPGWRIYTRDINRRGLGFVTPHRLPLGYGGIVQLRTASGEIDNVHFTLSRCREASPGWYEGCLNFNREQPQFD